MPAKEEEEFIPYLVLVRFDKGDAGSAARIGGVATAIARDVRGDG